jgi:predicted ATPase
MKIRSLNVHDFRSLHKVCWKPGNLNVLIGPNGSGKSNLVLLLKLISQSARGALAESVLSVGGINPLVWDHKADGFGFSLQTTDEKAAAKADWVHLCYDCEIKAKGRDSFYQVYTEQLRRLPGQNGKAKGTDEVHFLVRRGSVGQVLSKKSTWMKLDSGTIPAEETLLSEYGKPPSSHLVITAFHGYLADWSIHDSVSFHPGAKLREATVARHATRVASSGTNLINVMHTLYTGNRQFRKDLNSAMKAAFGDEFEELEFPPAADQRIQLRVRWRNLENAISASDLSAGTLHFLFLTTVLTMPSPPPLIVIEEPEHYLHPSMLPIVAEHAVDAALRTQVVFTTHSPQFLDAFGETRPTTTVLECRQGQTHIATLSGDRLMYWLEAFSLGKLLTSGILENEL